jgi:hypothetical protein
MYADDPDGGPETATNVFHVQLRLTNRRIAKAGLRITAGRGGGSYRIERL